MRREELNLPAPPTGDRPGDRWICGRADDRLACPRGPDIHGRCPLAEACRPEKTWHGRRKQIASFVLLMLVGIVFAMTRPSMRAEIIKPGDLSTPHAQILAGKLDSQRCASCHPQASSSVLDWFASASSGHQHVTQNDQCMDCHHTEMDRSTAKLAHNLPLRVRNQIRLASVQDRGQDWHDWLPETAVDQENVQCSSCHREHKGAAHDLTELSDIQCQTCHSDRFGDFAQSHPAWTDWPYQRAGTISFNHSSHAKKHFPATPQGRGTTAFQCADCHERNESGELTRSTSYERACKSCHDEALRSEASSGFDLLALPIIPETSASEIPGWPEAAIGFYDGFVSPITDLLVRSQPDLSTMLRRLPDRDFSRINGDNDKQVEAAKIIARAHRELLADVAINGQQAIVDRAAHSGIMQSTLEAFVQSLSPQLVEQAEQKWFGSSNRVVRRDHSENPQFRQVQFETVPDEDNLLTGNDLLSDDNLLGTSPSSGEALSQDEDLLGDTDSLLAGPDDGDPLSEQPLATINRSNNFRADTMMPAGGWYRDDVRLAIRYCGGGHQDPVLKAAIEMASQLPLGDPARENLMRNKAVAACIECHPGAGSGVNRWRSRPLIGRKSEFTKFAHGPHLNIANLADCQHCHRIATKETGVTMASGAGEVNEFLPMNREVCASCHQSGAAGDSCVKCHRYHIDLR